MIERILLNMTDEKVYTPEVVEENPFPGGVEPFTFNPATPAGTYAPTTEKQKSFPVKRSAVELLSTALNTRSRKVLGSFELEQSGGFQVGKFQEGVTGEMVITPNGLAARNSSGLYTIVVDSETGNAIFAGELRSGTLITGDIIVGNNTWIISGDPDHPSIKLYNNGIPEIVIGEP